MNPAVDEPLAPLVVLEGIDGSGKGTQAAAVANALRNKALRVAGLSFPRYSATFFGQRVGDFLNGRFGQLNQLDPFLVSLLYAGDRLESRQVLDEARRKSDVVVLDRYVHSNIAHQAAKRDGAERDELRSWIERVEHEVFGLPRPDLVVLLDLPVSAAQELISRKAKRDYTDRKADLQEEDGGYLGRVSDCYRDLAREPNWSVVPVTRDGEYRTVESITTDILHCIASRFPFLHITR